jgi:hypothetical protein
MSSASAPSARFARRSTRGVMLGFSGWRCAALGAAAALLLIGLLAGSVLLGVLMTVPFVAIAFVRVAGLYVVEWTPVVSHWTARKQTGQTRFRARPDKPRERSRSRATAPRCGCSWIPRVASASSMIRTARRCRRRCG